MTGMGLRGRLALFFVAITVLPLAVAAVALQLQNTAQRTALVEREIMAVEHAADLAVRSLRSRAGDAATDLGLAAAEALAEGDAEAAGQLVERTLAPPRSDRADFTVLADAAGDVVASASGEGVPAVPAAEVAAAASAGTDRKSTRLN